jgi:hypothetical protein
MRTPFCARLFGPNTAAAAILSLCDGSRGPDQIVANIATQRRGISPEDARGFLKTAKKLGWIDF